VETEKANIESELKRLRGFIGGIEKKLSNERFVNNAPTAVVEKEKKKLADGAEKIRLLEKSLAKLN
jgi:valyl-tRNA synthetase